MNIIDWKKEKIKGVLSTFDRIIIRGYSLQLSNVSQMGYFLSHNNVLLKDFGTYAEKITKSLCEHIENIATVNNRPYQYIYGNDVDKGNLAKDILEENPVDEGLICIFSIVELCSTMNVIKNGKTQKLELKWGPRKCKYYYLYYLDKDFGFMHIKIQSWFPFTVQIYINGHEWLKQQLIKENIPFEMYNNSFSYIENMEKAQEIADKIVDSKISDKFDLMIKEINNFLPVIEETFSKTYYWCLAECEYSTDIIHDTRESVDDYFKSLVEDAFYTFKCNDVMSFFGRKLRETGFQFKGEITSDLRKRKQGFRLKHKMKSNQIKMYDKGCSIRIETTINDPHEFKILKDVEKIVDHKEVITEKKWLPMGKSIANLYRYAEVCKAINKRYIEALPIPSEKEIAIKKLETISNAKEVNNRKYTGFNLFNQSDNNLFNVLANADLIINGFTNKILRQRLFKDDDFNSKKLRNKTTRIIDKLRKYGMIKKVGSASKYYITESGRELLNYFLLYQNKDIPNFLKSI